MILEIKVLGNNILREKSDPINEITEDIQTLITNMFETLDNHKRGGVGLAAPQVGINLQLFIISIKDYRKVFINPEILETSKKHTIGSEGCISIPGLSGRVIRPEKIKLKYQDENLEQYEEEFDGLMARVIQHEYDHLLGVLYIDKLMEEDKNFLEHKLKVLERRNKQKEKK